MKHKQKNLRKYPKSIAGHFDIFYIEKSIHDPIISAEFCFLTKYDNFLVVWQSEEDLNFTHIIKISDIIVTQ